MKRAVVEEAETDGELNHMPTNGTNGNHLTMDQTPPSKRACAVDEPAVEEAKTYYARMKIDSVAENDQERVAVLDFGAQYGKVIDRRVRESKVLSEMMPLSTTAEEILSRKHFRGIIISGGPASVYAEGSPQIDPEIFRCGLPVLGICYGFQLMNKHNGGSVARGPQRADGQTVISVDPSCSLFDGIPSETEVLLTHGDCVTEETAAPGFNVVSRVGKVVAGIANEDKKLYGVQFHPEVDLTTLGVKMFHNFLFKICACKGDYTMNSREEMCVDEIRRVVGDKKILVMVSGGVDSAVCAALLHKAIGKERVCAIHIDTGFMRENESDQVVESLNSIGLDVKRVYSSMDFYTGTVSGKAGSGEPMLDDVTDPEMKRQIIGNTFIRVKDDTMHKLQLNPDEYFLAQGTLRPDLIESASALASGHADKIKTHHNDTELVRKLREEGRVIEPLKDFHKDEVRELGASLGLPQEIVQRQPFPGPGLAIRVICAKKPFICADFENTQIKLNIIANLQQTFDEPDQIHYQKEISLIISQWGYPHLLTKDFEISATLLPIKSVGVQGDCRSYSYVAALSTDQRPIPWNILNHYAQIIPKLLHNINRVCYVFGGPVQHPVLTTTFTHLTQETTATLRTADRIATNILFGKTADGTKSLDDPLTPNCGKKIQQMPVVLIPVHFDRDPSSEINSYQWSVVLRPFITSDFMTGKAAIPGQDIPTETVELMASEIMKGLIRCSRVLLDLTNKPPGTTEWE